MHVAGPGRASGERRLAVFIVLASSLAATTSRALEPPPPFCEQHREYCHRLTDGERRYFMGLWQRARRAVVVPPGFRCTPDTGPDFDEVGFGVKPGRVVPEEMVSTFGCYRGPIDPRRMADVLVGVMLSPLPVVLRDSKDALEKRPGLLIVEVPGGGVEIVAGSIYEWRDEKGNVHRGYPPGAQGGGAEEIVASGPYIASVHFTFFGPQDAAGLKAFVAAFDRAGALAVIAAETVRRNNDAKRNPTR